MLTPLITKGASVDRVRPIAAGTLFIAAVVFAATELPILAGGVLLAAVVMALW